MSVPMDTVTSASVFSGDDFHTAAAGESASPQEADDGYVDGSGASDAIRIADVRVNPSLFARFDPFGTDGHEDSVKPDVNLSAPAPSESHESDIRRFSTEELYETFQLNRELIIESNPGSGIFSDVYVNPTSADGTPKGTAILDASFLEVKQVDHSIALNKERFLEDTLSAEATRIGGLEAGESITVEDHWDNSVQKGSVFSSDYDLAQSLGDSTVNSQGSFTVTVIDISEDGSRNIEIDYTVDNVLFDYYNWDPDLPLNGVVQLGGRGVATGMNGEPIASSAIAVSDRQMDELRLHGAKYYPLGGVVRETGTLTGTVKTTGRFFFESSELELDAGGNRFAREVVTDPDYVLPRLDQAIHLNGGKPDSVPSLSSMQRDNATVIGVNGYVDDE